MVPSNNNNCEFYFISGIGIDGHKRLVELHVFLIRRSLSRCGKNDGPA